MPKNSNIKKVVVIGADIDGLTSSVLLQIAGFQTAIYKIILKYFTFKCKN